MLISLNFATFILKKFSRRNAFGGLKKQQMNKVINRSLLFSLIAGLIFSSGFAQTSIKENATKGWHLLNKQTSGYYGISLDKAYDFLKGKKSTPVIVAVID